MDRSKELMQNKEKPFHIWNEAHDVNITKKIMCSAFPAAAVG